MDLSDKIRHYPEGYLKFIGSSTAMTRRANSVRSRNNRSLLSRERNELINWDDVRIRSLSYPLQSIVYTCGEAAALKKRSGGDHGAELSTILSSPELVGLRHNPVAGFIEPTLNKRVGHEPDLLFIYAESRKHPEHVVLVELKVSGKNPKKAKIQLLAGIELFKDYWGITPTGVYCFPTKPQTKYSWTSLEDLQNGNGSRNI